MVDVDQLNLDGWPHSLKLTAGKSPEKSAEPTRDPEEKSVSQLLHFSGAILVTGSDKVASQGKGHEFIRYAHFFAGSTEVVAFKLTFVPKVGLKTSTISQAFFCRC